MCQGSCRVGSGRCGRRHWRQDWRKGRRSCCWRRTGSAQMRLCLESRGPSPRRARKSRLVMRRRGRGGVRPRPSVSGSRSCVSGSGVFMLLPGRSAFAVRRATTRPADTRPAARARSSGSCRRWSAGGPADRPAVSVAGRTDCRSPICSGLVRASGSSRGSSVVRGYRCCTFPTVTATHCHDDTDECPAGRAAAVDHLGPGHRDGAPPRDKRDARRTGLRLRLPLTVAARVQRARQRAAARLPPGGTTLGVHSADHLLSAENELNQRRRLILNDHTPADLLAALLAFKHRRCCDVSYALGDLPLPTLAATQTAQGDATVLVSREG
jgi:hypothetical protein